MDEDYSGLLANVSLDAIQVQVAKELASLADTCFRSKHPIPEKIGRECCVAAFAILTRIGKLTVKENDGE